MRTVSCPTCRSFCRVPADASPNEEFACPDCGSEASLGSGPGRWAEVGVAVMAAPRSRTLARFDPVDAEYDERPRRQSEAPGVGFHGLVAALGLVIGFTSYFAATGPMPSRDAAPVPAPQVAAK